MCVCSQALGQVGKVLKVYADGDLRVAFGGQTWTFNPACLSAQPGEVDANLMTAENSSESGSKNSQEVQLLALIMSYDSLFFPLSYFFPSTLCCMKPMLVLLVSAPRVFRPSLCFSLFHMLCRCWIVCVLVHGDILTHSERF